VPASYPVIAPVRGGVIVAWTSGGPASSVIWVAELPARLLSAAAPQEIVYTLQ
jgi:hypothetical protein